MSRRTFPVDHRREFDALRPFLDGQGGVASVSYAGDRCAPNNFVETLTSVYEERWNGVEFVPGDSRWRSLRIDRDNYRVRYLAEIRAEFIRKMALELPAPVSTSQTSESMRVASNNVAWGSQAIRAEVHYHADNDVALRWHRDKWIGSLCGYVEDFLRQSRLMIILMHGDREDQAEFWSSLWCGGLEHLTSKGLSLVRMVNIIGVPLDEHPMVARPDVSISLPYEFDSERQAHAIEDIANMIIRRVPNCTRERAFNYAQSYVLAHGDNLNDLYNKIGFWLVRIKQTAAAM